MRHFNVAGKWGFNWAQNCSKPRLNAYGGGACMVSQTESEWINTFDWLTQQEVANQ
jgi:chromate transport protein ChrA